MSEYNLRKEDISQVLGNQTYKVPSLGLVTSEFERIDLILKSYLDFESERKTAEAARNKAEASRVEAEKLRAEAETNRVSAEEKRELAEQTRNQNVSDALSSIEEAQGYNIVGAKQVLSSQEDKGLNILQIDYKNGQHASFHVYNGSKGSQGEKGDKGDPGEKGEKGDKGADGGFADLGDIKVSVDATTGTPSASVSNVLGSDGKAQLTFKFSGIKGEKGEDGKNGKDGTNGTNGAKGDKGDAFTFADFTNEQLASLKGEKGDKGDMGSISKIGVSVDSEVGTPSATATVSKNTDGSTNIDFSFTGLKGEKGDKGEDGTGTNVTQKVSKARTRIVCRKAIRLGATKANGNLVKYFTHFPTISLKLDQKYIIYLNDVLVDVKALCDDYNAKSPYLCPTKFLSFSDSGEVSFAYNAEGYFDNAKTFSVPIDIHQSQGYLYHVDKVTLLESGVYEVRVVKGKTERDFSYNTDNVYLTISNGKLVSKVANIGMVELSRDKWIVDAKGKNFAFESYVKARVRKRRSKMNEDQARRKTDWYKYRMIPFSWVKAIGKTGLWKHYLYYKGILVSESRFILSRIYGDTDDVIYNIMRV